MKQVTTINEWLKIRSELNHLSIGLVHTMGNLHQGHMSLVKKSKEENDVTVAAIFINPTQFNQPTDFELYPRTLTTDIKQLQQAEVDYLLLFSPCELYNDDYQVQITETVLSLHLEGEYRSGHFTGMLTIVLKFLNLVKPTRSYYGEKDYQQLLLIKKMCSALFIPVEIIGCETQRDVDGLALSSRNARLSQDQRVMATHFPRLLMSGMPIDEIISALLRFGFKVDYVQDRWDRRLAAVWINDIRLIDNIKL
jgi:pantoate--beta-alanine ligase